MSRLQAARSISASIARISLILMLALVLLAGLIPSGALSASHSCKMDCCAGKPPHEAGACHASLTEGAQTEPAPQPKAEEHISQHQEMQMTVAETAMTAATTLSDHCRRAQPAAIQTQPAFIHPASKPSTAPRRAEQQQTAGSVGAVQSFTTPCSEECAAAGSMLMQVRRPRETAALASAAQGQRPPALASHVRSLFVLNFSSTERRRRIRPRAPPRSPVNL